MSAAELRQAAALMRERAEAATGGEWSYWQMDERLEVFVPDGTMSPETVLEFKDEVDCEECIRPTDADAAHIASWHPAVALAVADWLDHDATLLEEAAKRPGGVAAIPTARRARSLAVARAYLGTTP